MRSNHLDITARALAAAALLAVGAPSSAQAPGFVRNRLLVRFSATSTAAQRSAALSAVGGKDTGTVGRTPFHVVKLPTTANEQAALRAVSAKAQVTAAELDVIQRPADVTPNDTYYPYQWHLPKIAAPSAWSTNTGSNAIIVAICDTGCDPTHPDLAAKYVAGWNFYDGNSNTADVYGHGTAVAGTAAAIGNNGGGVAGVSWGSRIMPCRISDVNGYATYSAAANAITWAADHGARVANLSYQMTDSSTVASAAQYLQSKGGVVTIAAGNNATFDSSSDNPYVLTVSATDQNDVLASWSNTGNNVDVSAPGVSVYLTTNGGGYGSGSGTSFAAPIVAGTAALVLSVNPNLTGAQARTVIEQSADLVQSASGWTAQYGYGRVNASKAVAQALNTGGGAPDTVPPTVSLTSPTAGATVGGTITLQATASDNVGVTQVSFYLDGALVGTDTTSPYSLSWNSSSVPNGTHTVQATASDAAGNKASAQATVTVSNNTDTSPPAVSILSPTGGSGIGNPMQVSASATDNVGVVKVQLYVDGALSATDTSSPYNFNVNTKKWKVGSSHTLQCKAYDAAGNVGASAVVSVTK